LTVLVIQLFFSLSAKSPLFGKGSPVHEPGELLCGILAEVNNLPLIPMPIIPSSGNAWRLLSIAQFSIFRTKIRNWKSAIRRSFSSTIDPSSTWSTTVRHIKI
jgi:hypothetical protein